MKISELVQACLTAMTKKAQENGQTFKETYDPYSAESAWCLIGTTMLQQDLERLIPTEIYAISNIIQQVKHDNCPNLYAATQLALHLAHQHKDNQALWEACQRELRKEFGIDIAIPLKKNQHEEKQEEKKVKGDDSLKFQKGQSVKIGNIDYKSVTFLEKEGDQLQFSFEIKPYSFELKTDNKNGIIIKLRALKIKYIIEENLLTITGTHDQLSQLLKQKYFGTPLVDSLLAFAAQYEESSFKLSH